MRLLNFLAWRVKNAIVVVRKVSRWVARRDKLARELKREAKFLRDEIKKIPIYRYGSYTRGRADWQLRWDQSPGRRILMYSPLDHSGSLYQWAAAINGHTEYAARLITFHPHKHGYELDLLLPFPDLDPRYDAGELFAEADVIHVKDESGFFLGTNGLPKDFLSKWGKPMVFTANGGWTRKLRHNRDFQTFVSSFDARVAMTPDLNYEWFGGTYIPHAIDTDRYLFSWADGQRISHSPTRTQHPAKKGTPLLLEAVSDLQRQSPELIRNWELDVISNVSYEDSMERKSMAGLFFDQAGAHSKEEFGIDEVIGWYGNSAIEAMAMGVPTIAHLSADAIARASRGGMENVHACPIINVDRTVQSLSKRIETFILASPEKRRSLAESSRRWAVEVHGHLSVGKLLARTYSEVLERRQLSETENRARV